jgi:hypothetical protein
LFEIDFGNIKKNHIFPNFEVIQTLSIVKSKTRSHIEKYCRILYRPSIAKKKILLKISDGIYTNEVTITVSVPKHPFCVLFRLLSTNTIQFQNDDLLFSFSFKIK